MSNYFRKSFESLPINFKFITRNLFKSIISSLWLVITGNSDVTRNWNHVVENVRQSISCLSFIIRPDAMNFSAIENYTIQLKFSFVSYPIYHFPLQKLLIEKSETFIEQNSHRSVFIIKRKYELSRQKGSAFNVLSNFNGVLW